MSIKTRVAAVGAGLIIAGAGAVAAAPIASAFAVTPAPGGGTVHLNSVEAKVVDDANIGGLIDAVTPGWGIGSNGNTFGQSIDLYAGYASQYPTGKFTAGLSNLGTPDAQWKATWNAR